MIFRALTRVMALMIILSFLADPLRAACVFPTLDRAPVPFTAGEQAIVPRQGQFHNDPFSVRMTQMTFFAGHRDRGPAMKHIGIHNEVPISKAKRADWRAEADRREIETKTFWPPMGDSLSLSVTAKWIEDPNLDPGMEGSYLWRKGQLVIVTRQAVKEGSGQTAEMAAFHNGWEALIQQNLFPWWLHGIRFVPFVGRRWLQRIQHQAHILAAAIQLVAWGMDWHLAQARAMSIRDLQRLVTEDRSYHHALIKQYLGSWLSADVLRLENWFWEHLRKLIVQKRRLAADASPRTQGTAPPEIPEKRLLTALLTQSA